MCQETKVPSIGTIIFLMSINEPFFSYFVNLNFSICYFCVYFVSLLFKLIHFNLNKEERYSRVPRLSDTRYSAK